MPSEDLQSYEDAIEWVTNSDHDFDRNAFAGLSCLVHRVDSTFSEPWSMLMRRLHDDESWPFYLFYLGSDQLLFQIAVPLGQRDNDGDFSTPDISAIVPPLAFGISYEPSSRILLPVAVRRHARALVAA